MPRRKATPLTEREAAIMDVLWARGRATAEEVRAALQGRPHDSTVRTLLRVLETKGHVRHEAAGKVYVYRPVTARDKAQRSALESLLTRFFGGSAEDLVLRLLEEEHLTAEELAELLRSAKKPRPRGDKP
jgi:BlaI family transcriptional regulator, penicillinase repressor